MRISVLLLVLIGVPVASTSVRQHKTSRQPPPSVVQLAEAELIASATRKIEPSYPRVARAARVSGSVPVERLKRQSWVTGPVRVQSSSSEFKL